MSVYRYVFGSTLVDIMVTPTNDGVCVATGYVVFQGSLVRRPVLNGRDVLSARAANESDARDAVAQMLASRFGAPKPTPWAGQKLAEPDRLRILR